VGTRFGALVVRNRPSYCLGRKMLQMFGIGIAVTHVFSIDISKTVTGVF